MVCPDERCIMQFDLRAFLERGRTPYEAAFSLDLSGGDFPGYRVEAPAKVRFSAVPDAEGARITCEIEAETVGECARCLAPARRQYRFAREWQVRPADLALAGIQPSEDALELPLLPGGILPLDELVYQELVLEAEPLLLCSPGCEGLCPVCGRPKAAGCGCRPAEDGPKVDPRLAALQKLLE